MFPASLGRQETRTNAATVFGNVRELLRVNNSNAL